MAIADLISDSVVRLKYDILVDYTLLIGSHERKDFFEGLEIFGETILKSIGGPELGMACAQDVKQATRWWAQ